jgi:protein-S-isoprenylcysteine O-methyltransferase Ste14
VRILLTLAWIVAIVYATIPPLWLLIHPFAERWRAARVAPAKSIGLLWLALMVVVAALSYPWRTDTLYLYSGSWIAAGVFFLGGAWVYRRVGHFGVDNLVGRTELEPSRQQQLVTTGLHGRVRHPIYLAHLIMLTAWAVGTGLAVVWGMWFFALVTGLFMIRAEDAELERRFGDEFREYKRRVPAIFPF